MADQLEAEKNLQDDYDCYMHCYMCGRCGRVGCRSKKGHKYSTRQASLLKLKEEILDRTKQLKELVKKLNLLSAGNLSDCPEDPDKKEKKKMELDLDKMEKKMMQLVEDHQHMPAFYRVASWNICKLTTPDRSKKGICHYEDKLESISDTILYYQFDLIALQEVCQVQVADDLCKYLNDKSCLEWNYVSPEDTKHEVPVYLYNKHVEKLDWEGSLKKNAKIFRITPYICSFQFNQCTIYLINVHLRDGDVDKRKKELQELSSLLTPLDREIRKVSDTDTSAEPMIIILGDFNCHPKDEDNGMDEQEQKTLHSKYFYTHPIELRTNTNGKRSLDNLFCKRIFQNWYTFSSVGIIKTVEGMSEKTVSDHRPTWADFNLEDTS